MVTCSSKKVSWDIALPDNLLMHVGLSDGLYMGKLAIEAIPARLH